MYNMDRIWKETGDFMKKLIALFLALWMMLSVLPGCNGNTVPDPTPSASQPPAPSDSAATDDTTKYNKHLNYTLTDAQVTDFSAQLAQLEKLYMDNASLEVIDQAEEELEELSEYINDQCSIANVIYCCDTTDKTASDRFLKSQEIGNQIANDVMLSARRIYESDAPNKDYFFQDWTEAEMKKLMSYTEQVMELEQRNAEILVAYRDLSDQTLTSGMIPLYREMVVNNNKIAQIYGYDNYYTYAYELEYDRDYSSDKIAAMRGYVATYLAPLCTEAVSDFSDAYSGLTAVQQMNFSGLMFADYDSLGIDYVKLYIDSLPQEAREAMNKMFAQERVVFTDQENAKEGAFTTLIGDSGFCYFGPGYQNMGTVIHELGHYYGAEEGDMYTIPLDLAETQSQGNEWMFTKFMEDHLNPKMYQGFLSYQLYETIVSTVVQMVVDEFEQRIYADPNVADFTEADFNQVMEDVCKKYGGVKYFADNITDIQHYWRMVVVESPVYYISYAVSTMAALNIFTIAQQDYDKAMHIYCSLAEQDDYEDGFLGIIHEAGLPGPFDQQVYRDIYAIYQ